ncbi:MAG: type I-U CRISPR-associated protein Csx17, partial [Candidatus Eremiobacteraeota bacterium]|nr:type I-U CRISPR-associated protein Csx17 [Candidatus Eremiobacteraeota bacterium]
LAQAREVAAEIAAERTKDTKSATLRRLREVYPDDALPWLDAAVVIGRDAPEYPRLLGTGGNDGRLDFSVNFLQRALAVVGPTPVEDRVALLRDALDGTNSGKLFADVAIGQYAPASAGGVNATTGFDAESLVNPWDFVLLIEGAVVFAGSMAKRFGGANARAAFPFTFISTVGGYGSASPDEDVRGEVWLPRWRGAATYRSIATLIRTSRVDVDTTLRAEQPTARAATSAVEAAQAVIARGVSAGIDGFDRVVIAQRNGLAYAATRVGFVNAASSDVSDAAAALSRETQRWVAAVRRSEDALGAAARAALRAYDEAIFAFTSRPTGNGSADGPERRALQTWLAALGRLDAAVGLAPPERVEPFRFGDENAAVRIADALGDGSDEHALAAAWASVATGSEYRLRLDLAPVVFENHRLRYGPKPEHRKTLLDTLSAACARRYRIAHDDRTRVPIDGRQRSGVTLTAVARFLDHDPSLQLARIEQLLAGYVLLAAGPVKREPSPTPPDDADEPPVAWCATKLLAGGFRGSGEPPSWRTAMPLDPEVPQLLHTGRVRDALGRVYRAAQVVTDDVALLQERPLRDVQLADLDDPRAACAALLLPLDEHAHKRLKERALKHASD